MTRLRHGGRVMIAADGMIGHTGFPVSAFGQRPVCAGRAALARLRRAGAANHRTWQGRLAPRGRARAAEVSRLTSLSWRAWRARPLSWRAGSTAICAQTRRADVEASSAGSQPAPMTLIAIVGIACRLPGADAASFWRLLTGGGDAIGEVPRSLRRRPVPLRRIPRRHHGFDAAFFGVSPREAASMDPQQRLMPRFATTRSRMPASRRRASAAPRQGCSPA